MLKYLLKLIEEHQHISKGVVFFFDLKFDSVLPCLIPMALGDTPYRLTPYCETFRCLTSKIDNNNSGVSATLMMFGFLVSHYMERRRVDALTCVQTHITTLTLTITP